MNTSLTSSINNKVTQIIINISGNDIDNPKLVVLDVTGIG